MEQAGRIAAVPLARCGRAGPPAFASCSLPWATKGGGWVAGGGATINKGYERDSMRTVR